MPYDQNNANSSVAQEASSREALIAELREAFNAGVEQGEDEATAYEWGARSRQSRDDAFAEYLRDHDRRSSKREASNPE